MYSTGEFAKLAQVSKRLLRHYNEIGLLKPSMVDESNGYQYYRASQLPDLNRILVLKSLGLSLDQIVRLVQEDVSPETIRGMLLMKKSELEQQVLDELLSIHEIESRLNYMENHQQMMRDVVVKQLPKRLILGARVVKPSMPAIEALFGDLVTAFSKKRWVTPPPLIGILHEEDEASGRLDIEMGWYIDSPKTKPVTIAENVMLTVRELPPIETMATFVVEGETEDAHIGYSAIGEWADVHDYQFYGPVHEVLLRLPSDEQPMLTEIQFPVEKRNTPPSLLTSYL